MVTEGSPTTWLSCWVRKAFGDLRFRVTAASRYIAPEKFRVWESFGGGQSTGWLCGSAAIFFSLMAREVLGSVKSIKIRPLTVVCSCQVKFEPLGLAFQVMKFGIVIQWVISNTELGKSHLTKGLVNPNDGF